MLLLTSISLRRLFLLWEDSLDMERLRTISSSLKDVVLVQSRDLWFLEKLFIQESLDRILKRSLLSSLILLLSWDMVDSRLKKRKRDFSILLRRFKREFISRNKTEVNIIKNLFFVILDFLVNLVRFLEGIKSLLGLEIL
jgi:hypothetical protein